MWTWQLQFIAGQGCWQSLELLCLLTSRSAPVESLSESPWIKKTLVSKRSVISTRHQSAKHGICSLSSDGCFNEVAPGDGSCSKRTEDRASADTSMATWSRKMVPRDSDGCSIISEALRASRTADKFQAGSEVNPLYNTKRMTMEKLKECIACEVQGCSVSGIRWGWDFL